ncbi:hypothetical protein BX616_003624 [Lobosporangium transversale]|nr:hypothetical protein BX616_003624 [Lobosporangium transversale]
MASSSTNAATSVMMTTLSSTIMASHSVTTSGLVPRHATVEKTQPNPFNNNIGEIYQDHNKQQERERKKDVIIIIQGSSGAKDDATKPRQLLLLDQVSPPLPNANTASDASSSSSWMRSFKCSYDSEATAKSDRNGTTVVHIDSYDTTSTTLLSIVISSTSVKSTASQPGCAIQTDAVKDSTALISAKPRPRGQETSKRESKDPNATKDCSPKPQAEIITETAMAAAAIMQTPTSTSSMFMSEYRTTRVSKEQ